MQIATKHHDFNGLGDVTAATSALIADILSGTRRSSPLLQRGRSATEVDRLMRSGARIDAALALIALELPQWQPRRIAYDGGEWHCALSRTRELAEWLDQPAEGRHEDLALAILSAIVDAQRIAAPSRTSTLPSVQPQALNALFTPVSCDNYS
jgi:hypothetical protein